MHFCRANEYAYLKLFCTLLSFTNYETVVNGQNCLAINGERNKDK